MGLTSFSFPHAHESDPQFLSGAPLEIEENPSRWSLDNDQLVPDEIASRSDTVTSILPSIEIHDEFPLDEEVRSREGFDGIVGQSSSLRQVLQMVNTVAPGDSTVLLLGETGTGKELIARAIHNRSRRRERNFVKLNCAAIPTGLLESELFGHERGAFTGAIAQKVGRLELADQGSLFLDEIGDIPLELQPKLLRVLQEREFERLGSTRTKKVDVRVVAATHRNLEEMIVEKQFRSDLYYRLNVFPINIPPLRERPEDIPLLVQYFVQQFARKLNKSIESVRCATMDALMQYPWPGNIRELENVIERAVILSTGPTLRVPIGDLHTRIAPGHNHDRNQTLEQMERRHILATLKETRWVLSGPRGAATRLGLNRATLYFRMKKLGIIRPGTEA
jgi:formate hydrogenlyase transcriptional activator